VLFSVGRPGEGEAVFELSVEKRETWVEDLTACAREPDGWADATLTAAEDEWLEDRTGCAAAPGTGAVKQEATPWRCSAA